MKIWKWIQKNSLYQQAGAGSRELLSVLWLCWSVYITDFQDKGKYLGKCEYMFYNSDRLNHHNEIIPILKSRKRRQWCNIIELPSTVRGWSSDRRNPACVVSVLRCFLLFRCGGCDVRLCSLTSSYPPENGIRLCEDRSKATLRWNSGAGTALE